MEFNNNEIITKKDHEQMRQVWGDYNSIHQNITNVVEENLCQLFCYFNQETKVATCFHCPLYETEHPIHHPAFCTKEISKHIFVMHLLENTKSTKKTMENNNLGQNLIGMMFGGGMREILDAMKETLTEDELKGFEELPLEEKNQIMERVSKTIEQKRGDISPAKEN